MFKLHMNEMLNWKEIIVNEQVSKVKLRQGSDTTFKELFEENLSKVRIRPLESCLKKLEQGSYTTFGESLEKV